ncbi:hypothetical protein BC936DRAFT_141031 [Jimgerdemannia flammicorona]|uniref:Uncharacterized protein n=2 Tax=Jimgerdemannia flammicorona TaxID=994334 RepID=A0A433Q7M5_9FUNG|nr:hypothetical protein BC936DRAFT_141031 [Jimgerdemannia flammicorona]RUS25759.1 hypothetical protein BC938DRAFT_471698 [Jimgerdemannia flammicorona]
MAYECPRCGGQTTSLPLKDPLEPTKNISYVKDVVNSTASVLTTLRQQVKHLVTDNELLNTKFMDSVDKRGELEDNLAVHQMELERVQSENATLQRTVAKFHNMMEQGHLVEATQVRGLMDKLVEERNSKMAIESELEDLSRDLFEEANKMVAAERMAHAATVKRCSMLERRLKEVDELLASQKEQLTELKLTLEQVSNERDNLEVAVNSVLSLSFDEAAAAPISSLHPLSPTRSANKSVTRNSISSVLGKHQHRASCSTASAESKGSLHDSAYFSDACESPVFRDKANLARASHLSFNSDSNANLTFSFALTDARFLEFQDFLDACAQRPATLITNNNNTGFRRTSITTTPLPSTSYHKFLKRIQTEDIDPTLHFMDPTTTQFLSFSRLQKRLNAAMACNALVIERVLTSTLAWRASAPSCALCLHPTSTSSYHTYQYRIVDDTKGPVLQQPNTICHSCRARLASVCAYHGSVRLIQNGLVKDWEPSRVYAELLMRRMGMWMARCGADVAKADGRELVGADDEDADFEDERTVTGIAEEEVKMEEVPGMRPWEGRMDEVRGRDTWREETVAVSCF